MLLPPIGVRKVVCTFFKYEELEHFPEWCKLLEEGYFDMLQVGCRSHGDEKIDLLRVVVRKQRPSNEHLCCALGMANVGQLVLASNVEDVINECWHVVSAHLLLVEVPIGS